MTGAPKSEPASLYSLPPTLPELQIQVQYGSVRSTNYSPREEAGGPPALCPAIQNVLIDKARKKKILKSATVVHL